MTEIIGLSEGRKKSIELVKNICQWRVVLMIFPGTFFPGLPTVYWPICLIISFTEILCNEAEANNILKAGCGPPYTVGVECMYLCLPGFVRIRGSNRRQCQQDATWSGTTLQCESKSWHCCDNVLKMCYLILRRLMSHVRKLYCVSFSVWRDVCKHAGHWEQFMHTPVSLHLTLATENAD